MATVSNIRHSFGISERNPSFADFKLNQIIGQSLYYLICVGTEEKKIKWDRRHKVYDEPASESDQLYFKEIGRPTCVETFHCNKN